MAHGVRTLFAAATETEPKAAAEVTKATKSGKATKAAKAAKKAKKESKADKKTTTTALAIVTAKKAVKKSATKN
ncbi:MAG: hypothetical protein M3257_00455 [Actinomycetota bacterium]|nr:hypothetical protein [Actinomycetota bacterium]